MTGGAGLPVQPEMSHATQQNTTLQTNQSKKDKERAIIYLYKGQGKSHHLQNHSLFWGLSCCCLSSATVVTLVKLIHNHVRFLTRQIDFPKV